MDQAWHPGGRSPEHGQPSWKRTASRTSPTPPPPAPAPPAPGSSPSSISSRIGSDYAPVGDMPWTVRSCTTWRSSPPPSLPERNPPWETYISRSGIRSKTKFFNLFFGNSILIILWSNASWRGMNMICRRGVWFQFGQSRRRKTRTRAPAPSYPFFHRFPVSLQDQNTYINRN